MLITRLRGSDSDAARPGLRQWLERIGPQLERGREVLAFAAQRTREVRLPEAAASLTFTTVLSLVPLLAVVLAIFTAFPLFSEFRVALEKNLFRGCCRSSTRPSSCVT